MGYGLEQIAVERIVWTRKYVQQNKELERFHVTGAKPRAGGGVMRAGRGIGPVAATVG
jgi:hypothetical protein